MASGRQGRHEATYDSLAGRAASFDAREYANEAAEGQYQLLAPKLEEAVRKHRGMQVGMGRLKTGFGGADEDKLISNAYEHLSASLAANALQAGQLDLQGMGLAGDFAAGGIDQEVAKENAKRKRRGGLLGALGGIAGAAVGSAIPGVGTVLGAKLGGVLGQGAGEYV